MGSSNSREYQSIIIGSGPAGYTASIYLGRGNIDHLILASSLTPGGNLMNTSQIENFPGFQDGISGARLMENMQLQAEKFGGEIAFEDVTGIQKGDSGFIVSSNDAQYTAKSVIIASGASYKHLDVPGESEFAGKGISYCATCDGFFFKGMDVAVIGGGDSALEEAIFLSQMCKTVTIIHRRNEFRASSIMVDRIRQIDNINLMLEAQVEKFEGNDGELSKIVFKNGDFLHIAGAFIAIGHNPSSKFLQDFVEMDSMGYIKTFGNQSTSVEGIFAAGDCADPTYRQAITAAGSGARAAKDTISYLSGR